MKKVVKKSGFRLEEFIVKDFSINRQPKKQGNTDLDFNPSGLHIKSKNEFHLHLNIDLKDNNDSFKINISSIGIFKFKGSEEESALSNYFYTNAPAIIFPYIRAYISAVTALSGLNPINLPVMNLSGLSSALKENTQVKEIESESAK